MSLIDITASHGGSLILAIGLNPKIIILALIFFYRIIFIHMHGKIQINRRKQFSFEV